ncbi:MAG: arsenate reductase (glutaredoxin) [Gammaproteobacteria bacterium]
MKAIIYHNPCCSKSRQTLALLEERGVDVEIVEYLKDAPDTGLLHGLMQALGRPPREFIRRGEAPFTELGLAAKLADDEALIAAIAAHPVLLERPIVVVGRRAAIGRPPENVLALLDSTR